MTKLQEAKRKKNRVTTRITCSAPDAQGVDLAGSFNNWDPAALAMKRNADGQWSAELELLPGHYEYKFVVDGIWCCDPCSQSDFRDREECVLNEFGTLNRVLRVG